MILSVVIRVTHLLCYIFACNYKCRLIVKNSSVFLLTQRYKRWSITFTSPRKECHVRVFLKRSKPSPIILSWLLRIWKSTDDFCLFVSLSNIDSGQSHTAVRSRNWSHISRSTLTLYITNIFIGLYPLILFWKVCRNH